MRTLVVGLMGLAALMLVVLLISKSEAVGMAFATTVIAVLSLVVSELLIVRPRRRDDEPSGEQTY